MDELRVRAAVPADAAAIAQVHVDTWRSSYPDLVAAAYLESLSYARSETHWQQRLNHGPGFTYVVDAAGSGIVGFAAAGPGRDEVRDYPAELYALYVGAAYQRRGLGHALVATVAWQFIAQGEQAMMVWALAGNRYRVFYEGLGGVRLFTRQITVGGQALQEVAYGYRALTDLAPRASTGAPAWARGEDAG